MPDSLDSVLIVALVIAPGYVTLWMIRQRIKQFTVWAGAEFVVATVAMGSLVQAIAYPWPGRQVAKDYAEDGIGDVWQLMLWFALTFIIIPVAISLILSWTITRLGNRLRVFGLDPGTRIPRAWTFALSRTEGTYVRVWLTTPEENPTVIGGKFSTDSLASTDVDYADLFLEEEWTLDDDLWFVEPKLNSAGIWLSPESISRIEFIKGARPCGPTADETPTIRFVANAIQTLAAQQVWPGATLACSPSSP